MRSPDGQKYGMQGTYRQTVPKAELEARGQRQGWTESLDRLAIYLAKA